MQTEPTQSQKNETPVAVPGSTRQPWVKPILQKVALKDALATFPDDWNDIEYTTFNVG